MTTTDEKLIKALESCYLEGELQTKLFILLKHVVNRLIETSEIFNEHSHPVQVSMHSDAYVSCGSGHTSSPAKDIGFGCDKQIRIGHKSHDSD